MQQYLNPQNYLWGDFAAVCVQADKRDVLAQAVKQSIQRDQRQIMASEQCEQFSVKKVFFLV